MQFGSGSQFAAQCPRVPTPDGWRPWADSDGAQPEPLAKRAKAFADDASVPIGATESYPLYGVNYLIRVEPQPWTRESGDGCFRVGQVFLPILTAPTQQSGLAKALPALTVVSLVAGTAVAIATIAEKMK